MFAKLHIVPRWIIFSIDLGLSLFALFLATWLKYELHFRDFDFLAFYQSIVVATCINAGLFISFRIYAGIVRLTSTQDALRIVFAMVISAFMIFFVNTLAVSFGQDNFVGPVVLIVYSLFGFMLLFVYRVLVKLFFSYLQKLKLEKVKVLIYGSGVAGLAMQRTLELDHKLNKEVIAFIDDDTHKVGKTIAGIRILHTSALTQLILNKRVDELIFASYSLSPERKSIVAEICLEYGVRMLNVPAQAVIDRGHLRATQIQQLNIDELLNRDSIKMDLLCIQRELQGKRVLITGAAGSIGSEIIRQLTRFDLALIIMCDQNESALHELQLSVADMNLHTKVQAFIGDIRDENRMEELFSRFEPEYVYHAAAYKHVPLMELHPAEAIKTNVGGTKLLADLAVKYSVSKFVMVSTDKAVNPSNIMGASKRLAEIYVQSLNNAHGPGLLTRFITTRFGNVLGSNGSVIPRFKQQIERGGPVTVTHPEITRYFMTIPEACSLVLEAGCIGNGGEIFIFDMGKSIRIVELAEKMIRLAGLTPGKDIQIEFSGLRPGEKLYEELLNDHENTLPTHHEKIMIGKVREYPFLVVRQQINKLLSEEVLSDHRSLVIQMKLIVPEFKSMNSTYAMLDREDRSGIVAHGSTLDPPSIHVRSTFSGKNLD